MKFLLDTHAFLWLVVGSRRLSHRAARAIRDPQNTVYVSVASVWEAVLKHSLGKLPLPNPPVAYLTAQRENHLISSLAIDEDTVSFLPHLPPLHRDPFDRILICQAWQHELTIVTVDAAIMAYPVKTLF